MTLPSQLLEHLDDPRARHELGIILDDLIRSRSERATGHDHSHDGQYLRLDCSNDPLTGPLDIMVDHEHALRVVTGGGVFPWGGLLLDDFNRPDEGPPPSSDWTSGDMYVHDHRLYPTTDEDGNSNGTAIWSTEPASADHMGYITIYVDQAQAEAVGLMDPSVFNIRIRHVDSVYYSLHLQIMPPMFEDPGSVRMQIYSNAGLISQIITFEYHNGDSFGLSASGDHIVAWYKPYGGVWGSILSATDGSITGTGHLTLVVTGQSGSSVGIWSLDDFGGGGITEGKPQETVFNVNSLSMETTVQKLAATVGNEPPFTVYSEELVTHLNADMVDGVG